MSGVSLQASVSVRGRELPAGVAAGHEHDGDPALVAWCAGCGCTVLPMRRGTCGWCDAPVQHTRAPLR